MVRGDACTVIGGTLTLQAESLNADVDIQGRFCLLRRALNTAVPVEGVSALVGYSYEHE